MDSFNGGLNMDAVKFFKVKKRMTKSCSIDCENCPFSENNNKEDMACNDYIDYFPEKAVEIAEKWDKEHPPKTRLQVFFEVFPDAPKCDDGTPMTCAINCGFVVKCNSEKCRECWDEPVPDKYQY